MPIAAILEFATSSSEQDPKEWYDRASREYTGGRDRLTAEDWGQGFISHTTGVTQEGDWWVVDVWENQQAMDRFISKMMPILQRQPDFVEPNVRVIDVYNMVGTGAMTHA